MQKWILTPRQRCDVEMLLVDGFQPLTGFLSQIDYEHVVLSSRLVNNALWPIPITLDVDAAFAETVELGSKVGLYDTDNSLIAYLTVTDKWQPDKHAEAEAVYGTLDTRHPAVAYLLHKAGAWYLGGSLEKVSLPTHYDFCELRFSPQALKEYFAKNGINIIVGFQTRNPIHRAHWELTMEAMRSIGGHLLIHPVVGMTKPGDIDYFTRVRCYQKILNYYPENKATLALLPLAMRMAGPKEALWHALIRKNYGCTHFIVGRDHAGPGNNSQNQPFYDPYAAQTLAQSYQTELGIKILSFQEFVYVTEKQTYCSRGQVVPGEKMEAISGTQLRELLQSDKPIPNWFSFPEIISELRASSPPKHKQGFTLFFTGLSGAGKTTLARALIARLMSLGKRNISLLDGDGVRQDLTAGLGFSKADRETNIKRIGFVAAEVTKVGGIAICSVIAPYANVREHVRHTLASVGGFIEIFLSTSLAACEKRDVKGLYAKARRGELPGFTGIDDPYEVPLNPEITIDTEKLTIQQSVEQIIQFLTQKDYLRIETMPTKEMINERVTC